MFFLSNDEDININSANNVINIVDEEYLKYSTKRKTHIYCHAHHSAKTQNMDVRDILKYEGLAKVHVIDSSALAIQNLKSSVEDCPVAFVKVDEATATVTSSFRSMIIGFGESGRETFNFLYEFGAFVDQKGEKAPFHCTIIDENASRLNGNFYTECPALLKKSDIEQNGEIEEKELRFEECSIGSIRYWNIVKQEIKKNVNYIMVSVNDDEIGFEAAVNICRKAVEWLPDANTELNIYVRCSKQYNYERLSAVAEEMKRRYARVRLKIIGDIRELFTYSTIIDDTNLKRAKQYNWVYSSDKTGDIESCWIKELKLKRTNENPTISNIEDSIRLRDQNISNVLHAATKINILEKTGKGIEYWRSRSLEREPDTPYYQKLTDEEQIMLTNLARLEHERWMAASRLQGWVATDSSTDNKDERHKRHPDMRPWNELQSEGKKRLQSQSYDCGVVDTTIKIKLEEIDK